MGYRIKALKYMHINTPVPGCAMFFQEKLDLCVKVFGYFFLVQGHGHNILVDTGMGLPPDPKKPKRQIFDGNLCVEPGEDTLSLLAKEGIRPDEIDTILLSHLHTDHCWNVPLFPDARVYMSRRGWEAIESPRHPALFPDALYPQKVYKHLREKVWDRVVLVDPEDDVLPGIHTFWVGGHTACSHAVVVETEKGPVILCGDLVFYYANLEENIPVAYTVNLAECYEGMDRIRNLSGMVVPSHDPDILKRHPGGRIV